MQEDDIPIPPYFRGLRCIIDVLDADGKFR